MRWVEMFEADSGRLSMMRLTMFLSFFPASYVIIAEPTETMFGLYLGAYVVGYLGGKFADVSMVNGKQKDSALDVDSLSADVSITAYKPLATKIRPAGRGKKRSF